MYNNMNKNNMTRQKLGDLIQGIIEANKHIEILEKDLNELWGIKRPDRLEIEHFMDYLRHNRNYIKKAVKQLNLIKI